MMLFIAVALLLAGQAVGDGSDDVGLVIVGMRHGYRAPCSFLKDPENKDKLEAGSECMLVEIGRKQAFGLGALLRQRYADLLGDSLDGDAILSYASSASRTKETMEWLQRGLVAGDVGNYSADLPITDLGYEIDVPMLRAYKLKPCPINANGWAAVDEARLSFIQADLNDNKALLEYVSKFTNTEEAGGLDATNYGNLGDIADNIAIFRDMDLGQPSWIANSTLEGMSSEEIREKLITFQDAAQYACARYEPCANAMGGYWLYRVLKLIGTKAAGGLPQKKMVLMTSHSETTLSLMRLMGFTRTKLDFSAGFVIEVGKYKPDIRLFYHEPEHHHPLNRRIEPGKLGKACTADPEAPCPLGIFLARNAPKAIEDVEALCKAEGVLRVACGRRQIFTPCGPPSPDCLPSCDQAERMPAEIPATCKVCGDPGCFCSGGLLPDAFGNCRRRSLVCSKGAWAKAFGVPPKAAKKE